MSGSILRDGSTKVLLLEDDENDVLLLKHHFQSRAAHQFDLTAARSVAEAFEKLRSGSFNVILADLGLHDSTGLDTVVKLHQAAPAIPLIVLTGHNEREIALQSLRVGAQDFFAKDNLSESSLPQAIQFAIERNRLLQERNELIAKLEAALAEVKRLAGLLPICTFCKKVRDDAGYWKEVESYISARSAVRFSHSFCPDCGKKHFPEYVN